MDKIKKQKYVAVIQVRIKAYSQGDAEAKARCVANYGVEETADYIPPKGVKIVAVDVVEAL